MSEPARPWDEPTTTSETAAKSTKVWPWIVGVLAVIGVLAAVNGGGDAEPTESGAITACEDRVETLLKSPSSAKFSNVSTTSGVSNEWDVTGFVDSDNSFGASIRGTFTCHASSDDGELWTTSRVSIK